MNYAEAENKQSYCKNKDYLHYSRRHIASYLYPINDNCGYNYNCLVHKSHNICTDKS